MENSWVFDELKEVRNCHQSFHWGTVPGLAYTFLSTVFMKVRNVPLQRNVRSHSDGCSMGTYALG